MAPRFSFGSFRALLIFLGFLLVFGILAELDKASHGALRGPWFALWCAFIVAGSIAILIRMWRKRDNPGEFWKSAHRGAQIGVLPPRWQRWMLGEDDRR